MSETLTEEWKARALAAERERDEALTAFASGAYEDACKRETGIHQHALAYTVEQFRKAEARALAAEAERDALRKALDLYREAVRIDVLMEGPKFMGANSSALKRAWEADRALTEKNNER